MKLGTNDLKQYLRDAANRAGLPRFWRWWMGELAPLLPDASRVAFQRRFARPVIELNEGEAVFWRPEFSETRTRLAVAERVSLNGDAAAILAAGRAAVARLAESVSGGLAAPKVVIALGPRDVLRKELVLPAAVEENLAQTLAYDLDRHTPFRADQLYFDVVVIGRDGARKMLRVDWAAVLKTIVDAACRRVEDWGAVPVSVVPGPPTAATKLNLMPEGVRPRPLQWRRWQVWGPVAALAVFAFAAVFVPLVQKRQYAVGLNVVGAEIGQQAEAAAKLRTQLEGMQNDYNYILAKKYGYPSVVHVVDEVTRALPDDTWLTQLEVKTVGRGKDVQREIYLRGESGNAGKLVALLEDSKLVEQAAPRSPTTKIQGGTGEIFDLGAKLRPVPPPAAEQMVIGALPAAASLAPAPATSLAAPLAAPAPAASSPEPAPTDAAPESDSEAARAARRERRAAQAPQGLPPMPGNVPPATAAGFGPFPGAPVAGPPPGAASRAQRPPPAATTQLAPAQQPAQPPTQQPAPQPAQQRAVNAPVPGFVPVPAAQPQPAPMPAAAPAPGAMPAEPSPDIPPAPTMPGAPPSDQPPGNTN